jgi:hypothetical protein
MGRSTYFPGLMDELRIWGMGGQMAIRAELGRLKAAWQGGHGDLC